MSKDCRINFRLTIKEKEEIISLADTLGYNSVSDYISTIALSGLAKRADVLPFEEIAELKKSNPLIENKINEFAKHLNTYKSFSNAQVDEYLNAFRAYIEIREQQTILLQSLIKKLKNY
jgi:hypothetical protein